MTHANARLQALADGARASGVVGAGGGGFSLADKLLARPYRTLIINAAQSEPLICKDWAALAHYGNCVLNGAQLLIEAMNLSKAFLATREEFCAALPDLPAAARKFRITVARLPDIYPLGYEKILKRELLAIPMNDGRPDDVLVINAETLRNLYWAVSLKRPVTTKLITVGGAVNHPISLQVPIGTSFGDCLAQAGGASCANYAAFHNGVMSGQAIDPANAWVSATTQGYVLLPPTHSAVHCAPAGDAMGARLAERRAAFFEMTLAGRTQAMSAAYALFDLTSYRRSRLAFHELSAADELPERVRISGGQALSPGVAVGEQVRRGQAIATRQLSGVALHASVHGFIEAIDGNGIGIRRSDEKELSA
jgi:Na+-translocating ferredoxin:NAD+ oxidoreductase RnfC subunit